MKRFFRSKVGLVSVCVFIVFMALMSMSVLRRRPALGDGGEDVAKTNASAAASEKSSAAAKAKQSGSGAKNAPSREDTDRSGVADTAREDLLYLDRVKQADSRSVQERDSRGVQVTRRRTPASLAKRRTETREGQEPEPSPNVGGVLRLSGRSPGPSIKEASNAAKPQAASQPEKDLMHMRENPLCFVPYGRPIKCELVFAVDSTMDQTPLVGLVMEPVYNNGFMVIPAGSELHGMARPDRLRDRIFSSAEWVLVFPRDGSLPNGRQLSVRGLALDRIEPQASGLTWGITDGSYGLQGAVIRSMEVEEIKRFAATFLSAGALALQQTQTTGRGSERVAANARNATLEGIAASLEDWSKRIGEEIARNGVFIRIAGGKQFYFYPQQTIVPSRAEIP